MKSKHSGLVIALIVLSAVCAAAKLLISYLFPISRFLLLGAVPALAVLTVIFLIKSRRRFPLRQVVTCTVIPAVVILFTLLPIDRQLELARFHAFRGAYASACATVQGGVSEAADTADGRYSLPFPCSLLNPVYSSVRYIKQGNSVAVVFPASESLSITRNFVYFSDEHARDLFEHPQKFGSDCENCTFTGSIEELGSPQWAYVLTWGSDMVPKDPNL